jgi:hypothetical protein
MKIITKTLDKIFAIHNNYLFVFYLDYLYYNLNNNDYIGYYINDFGNRLQVLRGSEYSIHIENLLYN